MIAIIQAVCHDGGRHRFERLAQSSEAVEWSPSAVREAVFFDFAHRLPGRVDSLLIALPCRASASGWDFTLRGLRLLLFKDCFLHRAGQASRFRQPANIPRPQNPVGAL
jgi:hypothetical protein